MQRPLLSCWRISAPNLPDSLLPEEQTLAFSLPGAEELLGFADLLGEPALQEAAPDAMQPSAPFPLPALLPDALCGEAELTCEVDFGALSGDHAVLTFAQLLGRGSILLGDTPIAAFDSAALPETDSTFDLSASPCAFAVDLTDALRRGRKETIAIRFDSTRPAGVRGPVFLQTARFAFLSRLCLLPDAAQQTITVRALITADHTGEYALRAQPVPPAPGSQPIPAREISLSLGAGEARQTEMTLALSAKHFVPGAAYDAPAVKIELLRIAGGKKASGILCDSTVLSCGYSGHAPLASLPLDADDLLTPPEALMQAMQEINVSSVSLHAPASERFYLCAARAGISVVLRLEEGSPLKKRLLRHPCLTFAPRQDTRPPLSPAASAWQLCGMIGCRRASDEALSDRALLYEAAGHALDPQDEGICGVLEWLEAVSVRLRCEAARQGRFAGALCETGAWRKSDVSDAIRTAFAPLHLSALPLCGAWWTGTRFSASLEAFIPEGTGGGKPLSALAVLEDEKGRELARLFMPCRSRGGYVGVIDAQLPDSPCTLELRTQLLCADEILEESTLPVYVGERGPLEAAFL
ncbi:MAG: hypothetical protein IKK34_01465 [Clostridia bacterium]|nr:hypothetical protein [Clostridia bacterium]